MLVVRQDDMDCRLALAFAWFRSVFEESGIAIATGIIPQFSKAMLGTIKCSFMYFDASN